MNGEPIYAADGRVVGAVRGNEFQKRVRDGHFLVKPRALASDVDALRQAEQVGAVWFVAQHVETGKEYRAPIVRFFERGIKLNRGHNAQLALLLSDFNVGDETPTPRSKPTQPLLFPLPRL